MTYILQAIYNSLWAIQPEKLAAIIAVAERHAAGQKLATDEVAAIMAAGPRAAAAQTGAVAVLGVYGTIIPRGDMLVESSGAVSTTRLAANLRAALADPAVGAIVLDISSPGGAVQGVEELAAEIYAAREVKPIVAVANHLAASAAYWIGTAANELFVAPSGEVGSIGVFAAHQDFSRALEKDGVTVNLISAGKYKTEANPYQPLTEEARAAIQARVDDYYNAFTKSVARSRGVSVADVRDGFGEGRVVGAAEAVQLGMADKVGTLDDAIVRAARMARSTPAAARAPRADLEMRQRRLRLAEHS